MEPKHFYCDLFGVNFYFFVGWSEKKFCEYTVNTWKKHCNVRDANGFTRDFVHKDNFIILIWTRRNVALPNLLHECLHATNITLEHVGILASFLNDELQAYYTQRLFKIALSKKYKH